MSSIPDKFSKKETTLIVYPPGGYGTFLLWCLYYFSGNLANDQLPFFYNGSSHGFGEHWFDNEEFKRPPIETYLTEPTTVPFVRSHGRWDKVTGSYNKYIADVINYFNRIIVLEPGDNDELLILGNMLSKTVFTKDALFEQVVTRFFKQFNTDPNQVPVWQLREMISYWFDGRVYSKNNYQNIVNNYKILRVPIRQLVDDLEGTLVNLFNQLELQFVNSDKINYVNEQWLALQKYKAVDALCENIVNAVVCKDDYEWDPASLDIISEAYIQFRLRTLYKLDLLCYNLNIFPSSAHALRELLIKYK